MRDKYTYGRIRYFFKRQYRYLDSPYRREEMRSAYRRLNVRKAGERKIVKSLNKYWNRKGTRYIDIWCKM